MRMRQVKITHILLGLLVSHGTTSAFAASEPFIGELMWTAASYCPRGWADANGQLIEIAQNHALFALLGTTYGGNGRTTFGLPDLRGRVAVHLGQGPGLSPYPQGHQGGAEQVALTESEIPAHSHTINASQGRSHGKANGSILGSGRRVYDTPLAASTQLHESAVNDTGGGQPHENRPPYLTLRACIALIGVFPSRN